MPSGVYKRTINKGWFQKEKMKGNKNAWGGDEVKISAMHKWVAKENGRASEYKCVDCGEQAIDWSNVDHSWRRNLEDYFPRCRKCHSKYDKEYNKLI